MSVHLKPWEIEAESFRTIDLEAGPHQWSPLQWPVVRRAVHTTADFEYIRTMSMSAVLLLAMSTSLEVWVAETS